MGVGGLVPSSRHPCHLKSRGGSLCIRVSNSANCGWSTLREKLRSNTGFAGGELGFLQWPVRGSARHRDTVREARQRESERGGSGNQRGEAVGIREGRRRESARGGGGSQGAEVAGVREVVGVSWETSHTWVQVCGTTGSGAFPPHAERTTGRVTAKAQS